MNSLTLLAAVFALLLAGVHLFGGRLRWLAVVPRSRWLSGASGVSVAYVFVHILPDLAEHQKNVRESTGLLLGFIEHHVYLLALLGMMVFYGLERLAILSPSPASGAAAEDATEPHIFWIHIGAFSLYNLLIGYLLLHREEADPTSLSMYFIAMATHFLVNDHGLRHAHKHRYDHAGRWLLALAVLGGWVIGASTRIHAGAVSALFAFLAGGIVLNVLKEELPEERESSFRAFAIGAAAYTAILVAI